jgi:hypothetical protein
MIREVTGHHDERTVKKRTQDLMKYGYILEKGYTGAFLILDTGTDIEHIERVMEQQKQEERNINNINKQQAKSEFDNVMKDYGV